MTAPKTHPASSTTTITKQSEKSAQTRIKILEATLDSLFDLGYFETTFKTIVDYAGVSRGAVGYHFRSKSEIIIATIEYNGYPLRCPDVQIAFELVGLTILR